MESRCGAGKWEVDVGAIDKWIEEVKG